MGVFGSGDKIATSEDNRIVGQNSAVITAGNRTVGPGSVSVGSGAYISPGAVNLGKTVKLAKGASLNVTVGDNGAGVAAISQQFNDTLTRMNTTLGDQFGKTSDALKSAISDITGLSESKQTDGEAGKNRIVLYIGLGLLAVVGIFFWRMGK